MFRFKPSSTSLLITFLLCFHWPCGNISDANPFFDLSFLGPNLFGNPSEQAGRKVSEWSPKSSVNVDELGDYLYGDILVPESKKLTRSGVIFESTRWPNGIIPYAIQGRYTTQDRSIIDAAIMDFHKYTCLRFVRADRQPDYLAITNTQTGCWSAVGKVGGRQELNLQAPGCTTTKGTVIHEMMHAVGFIHEQNRPERDKHVIIEWDNISPGNRLNFEKSPEGSVDNFNVDYDYRSVMHYSEKAFSVNSKPTIKTRINGVEIGQRKGFSRHDVMKIRRMYNCSEEAHEESKYSGLFG